MTVFGIPRNYPTKRQRFLSSKLLCLKGRPTDPAEEQRARREGARLSEAQRCVPCGHSEASKTPQKNTHRHAGFEPQPPQETWGADSWDREEQSPRPQERRSPRCQHRHPRPTAPLSAAPRPRRLRLGTCRQGPHSPSSSLLSPAISTDSDSEARDVRREDAAEVALAALLPGSRLTQCSHREELVEPAEKGAGTR